MPERVAARPLVDARAEHGLVNGVLDRRSLGVVAAPLAKYLGASREDFVKPEKKAVGPVVP